MTQITIIRPDDWHLHLRDGAMLKAVLPETARDFERALIMPNLVPPVVTSNEAVLTWFSCTSIFSVASSFASVDFLFAFCVIDT